MFTVTKKRIKKKKRFSKCFFPSFRFWKRPQWATWSCPEESEWPGDLLWSYLSSAFKYMTAPLSGDEFWLWWTFHLQKICMLAFWLWYVSVLLLAFSSLYQTKASQSCYLLSFFHWNCFYLLMMYYAVGPELHWNLVGWCVHVCIAGNTVAGYVLYVLCFDQSLLSFVTATKFISLLAAEIMI